MAQEKIILTLIEQVPISNLFRKTSHSDRGLS